MPILYSLVHLSISHILYKSSLLSMMRTVIFFMAKTDKTAKYVPEKFELISRKQKDFFINWVKRFHVFPYYCQSIQMVHREVNKLFKDLNKNIIRTVWKEWKAKNLSVDIINKTFLRVQSVSFQRIPQVQQNQHPPLDNPICI